MADQPTVLIAGASRGLGLALAEEWCGRSWRVIATVRRPSEKLNLLRARYPAGLRIETVDIADAASVRALRERLEGQVLDVLFVNAGISSADGETPSTADETDFAAMMVTNALAPVRMVEIFQDLVVARGVIAVMSSELGSIADNTGLWDLYSASKAALNMLMKCFAARRFADPRAMLAIAPGWVRTDMGGARATYSIEDSIPLVADTVERNRGEPGLRFVDRRNHVLPW
jgi:NAD(P)-dependent dehydrogenase (short-subunit alcohol dehydrogenase family)